MHKTLITLTEPQLHWLRTQADQLDINVSELVRRIIDRERHMQPQGQSTTLRERQIIAATGLAANNHNPAYDQADILDWLTNINDSNDGFTLDTSSHDTTNDAIRIVRSQGVHFTPRELTGIADAATNLRGY